MHIYVVDDGDHADLDSAARDIRDVVESWGANTLAPVTIMRGDAALVDAQRAVQTGGTVDTDPVAEHLDAIAEEAGSPILAALLGILRDRGTVTDERLLALDVDDALNIYDSYVGPAVDGAEDYALANEEDR